MQGRRPADDQQHRRAERRVGARLFGRWRGLSAVPVWPIGWSLVLYIYTSPSLGRMSASAASRSYGAPRSDRLAVAVLAWISGAMTGRKPAGRDAQHRGWAFGYLGIRCTWLRHTTGTSIWHSPARQGGPAQFWVVSHPEQPYPWASRPLQGPARGQHVLLGRRLGRHMARSFTISPIRPCVPD